MFMEDLELYMQTDTDSGLTTYEATLIVMLCADDMVTRDSPEDMQRSLDTPKPTVIDVGCKSTLTKQQ